MTGFEPRHILKDFRRQETIDSIAKKLKSQK
jgi:hypothetical protein